MRRALLLLLLLVLALPLALAGAILLALEDRPLVARPAALGPAQIERARRILEDSDPRRLKPGAQRTVSLSQQDLDLLANYFASRYARGGAQIALRPGVATVAASGELPANPVGRFLNVRASLRDAGALPPRLEDVTIGRLPVPDWLANPLLDRAWAKLYENEDIPSCRRIPRDVMLVLLNRGLGFRTALATATRGDGGQNEIGPELFDALGVLRTEELAAMHRFDGAEQYFTRAVDFGLSFSIEETFQKWGRDEIIGDFVRLIRTVRPDVMLTLRHDGEGGGQHHQASAVLAREAFKLAADPTKYPEQLKAGLRPWQPKKLYIPAQGFGGRGAPPAPPSSPAAISINLASYDSLLGRTFDEIGTEARSMHKCQGMAQLLALPDLRQTCCSSSNRRCPAD